jgi:hypothetical protein
MSKPTAPWSTTSSAISAPVLLRIASIEGENLVLFSDRYLATPSPCSFRRRHAVMFSIAPHPDDFLMHFRKGKVDTIGRDVPLTVNVNRFSDMADEPETLYRPAKPEPVTIEHDPPRASH